MFSLRSNDRARIYAADHERSSRPSPRGGHPQFRLSVWRRCLCVHVPSQSAFPRYAYDVRNFPYYYYYYFFFFKFIENINYFSKAFSATKITGIFVTEKILPFCVLYVLFQIEIFRSKDFIFTRLMGVYIVVALFYYTLSLTGSFAFDHVLVNFHLLPPFHVHH